MSVTSNIDRTLSFCNDNIVEALRTLALIKFGEKGVSNSCIKVIHVNDDVSTFVLRHLVGMPVGRAAKLRCMCKIVLANQFYQYLIGNIKEDEMRIIMDKYSKLDKVFYPTPLAIDKL